MNKLFDILLEVMSFFALVSLTGIILFMAVFTKLFGGAMDYMREKEGNI